MEPNQISIEADLLNSEENELSSSVTVNEEDNPIAKWRLKWTRKEIDPILFGAMISINFVVTVLILFTQ